jgi:murein DD-endopeptidase MepM/ murein hydrolase activator NlpD
MNRLLFTITMIACISWCFESRADIYRYEGEDEVISFTDTPNDKRYQLVMKEPQLRSSKTGKRNYLNGSKQAEPATTRHDGDAVRTLPVEGIITSTTGLRTDPFNGSLKHHNGLDIAAPSGTPVRPVAPGTVIFSGWKGGYGNTVILDHHDGMVTVYAHHASNNVVEGAVVDLNTVIALTGSTGRSTGPHLHFEAWQDGTNITADFIPGSSLGKTRTTLAKAPIRRLLQADGTLLFTNLR